MTIITPEQLGLVLSTLSRNAGHGDWEPREKARQLHHLLRSLPPQALHRTGLHATVDVCAAGYRVRARFRGDGSMTSLAVTHIVSQRVVVDWSEQAWLRAELVQQGVDVPRAATLWRHPQLQHSVYFDWRSRLRMNGMFKRLRQLHPLIDAPALLDTALEALVHGGARDHRAMPGDAGHCLYSVGHWHQTAHPDERQSSWAYARLVVRYHCAQHAISRLRIHWNGVPVIEMTNV